MNPISRVLALLVLLGFNAKGQSTGLCLFASGPEVPATEVQAFEFERYEKISDGIRCFPSRGGSVVITKYKLRGIIPYPKQIAVDDYTLPSQMEALKAYAAKYPRTLPFLTPIIEKFGQAISEADRRAELSQRLQHQTEAYEKQIKENEAATARQLSEQMAARVREVAFDEAQRKKGLVKQNGRWMTPAEYEKFISSEEGRRFKEEEAARLAKQDAQNQEAQAQADAVNAQKEARILAAEDAHYRESAAVEQAREVAAAEKKLAASAVMLRGNVEQITSEGMLVSSHYGSVNIPNAIKDPKNRPDLQAGDFFLTGHPRQDNKVTDSWFDVDAVYDGVFEYTTVLGATRRVHRFRVLKAYY